MTEIEYSHGGEGEILCKACGLCCTGHLFSWVQIKKLEHTSLRKLGLTVVQPDEKRHGFSQPCPMWEGECTIYKTKNYPSGCRAFNCKLLRELLDESVSLPRALRVVKRTKKKIDVIEKLLPSSQYMSFRDRVVEQLSYLSRSTRLTLAESELQAELNSVLNEIENRFGVRNFNNIPETG